MKGKLWARWLGCLLVLAISIAGCQAVIKAGNQPVVIDPSPEPTQETPLPEDVPSQTASASPTLPAPSDSTPTPNLSQEVVENTHYDLSARYDHARYTLAVSQQVDYVNAASVELSELVFLVEPNRYANVFQLERLTWKDGEPVKPYTLNGNRLTIPLPQPLQAGERVQLGFDYQLALPPIPEDSTEYKPVPFGYTARQVNLVDWYPFLPPYRTGEGWLAHDPWFFGEHQVYDVADYEVEFEVLNAPEPLVLAASSQPESVEGDVYHYRLEQARTFVISLSPYYRLYTRQVGGTLVLSYGLPYFEEGAQAALQYTAEALELYNELYGVYARDSLSVVVADFLDGMEYDGLYFLSRGFYNLYDGTPAGYLTIIAVHETAHQWWYARVGNDQALEPWLDEALCTYSERLYYERLHPELADWWWAYRVNFYAPAGPVGGRVYDYAGFRPYRDAVYLRGAQFLEALRRRVGEETFFAFLKEYSARMAGKQATAADFFATLAEQTPAEIDDLRQEYFGP